MMLQASYIARSLAGMVFKLVTVTGIFIFRHLPIKFIDRFDTDLFLVNSLMPSDAYMHQQTRPLLVQKMQAGKLKFFGTRPNWVVSYIAYTKFHSPRPVFHSPGQIFTRIGER